MFLIAIGAALYALANLVELIRIGATDWDGSHFVEHVGMQILATALVCLYFGQGRIRARWPWVPRF